MIRRKDISLPFLPHEKFQRRLLRQTERTNVEKRANEGTRNMDEKIEKIKPPLHHRLLWKLLRPI
jgi:hypothetical protein